jgi:hypothetical protein
MAIGAGMLALAAAMPAMAASAATTSAPPFTNFAAQATSYQNSVLATAQKARREEPGSALARANGPQLTAVWW